MNEPPMSNVTDILNAIDAGDPQAPAQLLPLVYDELRRLAAQRMAREMPGQTLDATALVHEAYLRLVGSAASEQGAPHFNSRGHLFAAAAEAMRRILVEAARRRRAAKRGGDAQRQELHAEISAPAPDEELLALHEALDRFAVEHPEKAELVKLRYFAGLSADDAARVLGVSPSTADRHWAFARAWLKRAMS